ncbi:unnamed protein product, partial [Closterium sp. NIES-53]
VGGQGAGGGGGVGEGGVTSGGGGSAGVGGAPRAAPSDSPAAAGRGDTRGHHMPAGLPTTGTPHAMYDVVNSSASDSIYSSVFSLGASVAEVHVASVDTSPGAAPEDASLTFTLDSGASHCFFPVHTMLTPLPAPLSLALADPTSRPVTPRYTTTLSCPAVPSGFLTAFHVPSFSRNLVGVRPLVDSHVGVWIEPSGDTPTCVDGDTYAPLATFHAEPGSVHYTLHTGPQGRQQQQQQQLPPTPLVTHPFLIYALWLISESCCRCHLRLHHLAPLASRVGCAPPLTPPPFVRPPSPLRLSNWTVPTGKEVRGDFYAGPVVAYHCGHSWSL